MISPQARHVIRLSDLNRSAYRCFTFGKKIGLVDIIFANSFYLTPKHSHWYPNAISHVFFILDMLSIDLSQYGIPKPTENVFKCNVRGNLQVMDWEDDHSCIDLIKSGRITCICDFVTGFETPNLITLKNSQIKILKGYDSVVLCTGYGHGLEHVFDKKLYDELFEQSMIYKTWGIVPKTNGYNQSTVDKTLFFVGLLGDYSVLSGYANGYWGWQVARTIAKHKGVYDWRKEPSTWNAYTLRSMTVFVFSMATMLAGTAYCGLKAYKTYFVKTK
eukprot:190003_1